jgi:hypothetical protein
MLPGRRIAAVIPPIRCASTRTATTKIAYKGRIIEKTFCLLMEFRRIATSYDKRTDILLYNPLGRSTHLVD